MGEHSIISPSKAKRIIKCPGSIPLCQGIPRTTSVYAEEGSGAHYLSEQILLDRISSESLIPDKMSVFKIGKVWGIGEAKAVKTKTAFLVTEEMLGAAYTYTDGVFDLQEEAGKYASFGVEQKLDMSWISPGMKGTADAVIGLPLDTLHVCDLKYGKGVAVDAYHNEQLMLYALGVLGPDNPLGYEDVVLHIFQPRACSESKQWRTTVAYLYEWLETVFRPAVTTIDTIMDLRGDDLLPFLQDGEHCRFCDAKKTCPRIMTELFGDTKALSTTTTLTLPSAGEMTPGQLSRALELAEIITSWSKGVVDYAEELIASGGNVPGWKHVAGQKRRSWEDEIAVIAEYGPLAMDHVVMSPAQLEKAVKKAGGDPRSIDRFVKISQGRKLVRESDPRPALNTVTALFGAPE